MTGVIDKASLLLLLPVMLKSDGNDACQQFEIDVYVNSSVKSNLLICDEFCLELFIFKSEMAVICVN